MAWKITPQESEERVGEVIAIERILEIPEKLRRKLQETARRFDQRRKSLKGQIQKKRDFFCCFCGIQLACTNVRSPRPEQPNVIYFQLNVSGSHGIRKGIEDFGLW